MDWQPSTDELVMQVNFDRETNDYHQEFILLAENDPDTIIPEWLHIGLRDSLGWLQSFATQIEPFTAYSST